MINSIRSTLIGALALLTTVSSTVFAQEAGSKLDIFFKNKHTGWAYPPKDYAKWAELVFQWTKHCVEKYGRTEVESWYWEVWNEPNIGLLKKSN